MFQRVSSSIRIALIKEEKKRIEALIKNPGKSKTDLTAYLDYLNKQLNMYPCLNKK